MDTAVRPDDAPFCLRRHSCLHGLVDQLDDPCPIVRVQQILPGGLSAAKSTRPESIDCLKFWCPSIYSRLNIPLESSNASSLLCQSKPFFTRAQCLFRLLLCSDVTEDF